MIRCNATLSRKILDFGNVVRNTDSIEILFSTCDCRDLINRKVKITAISITTTGAKYGVLSNESIVVVTAYIEVAVSYITSAHTEGRVTVCYENNIGSGVLAHFHLVGQFECFFPVGSASRTEPINL